MLFKRPGSKYYWTKFEFRGETIRKSTGATDKKTARSIEAKIRAEMAQGNFGILQPKESMSLKEFLTKHFEPYVATRFKETTPKTYIYYSDGMKYLMKTDLVKHKLDEITNRDATRFSEKMKGLSASTANCGLRTLRRALKLAEQWGELNRAPKIELAKGERQRDRVLTEEEVRLYLMACAQPWRDVATMLYCLGMRPSEVYCLRWESIALGEEGFIQIIQGKSKSARRMLPLVPSVQNILENRHKEQGFPSEGWVFPSESKSGHLEQGSAKNQHLKAIKAVNDAAKEESKKKGIENPPDKLKPFAPYSLRHTALTNLAEQCDTFALKTIAGHSSITITQRYVHPQAEAITQAFKKIADRQKVVTAGGHSESGIIEPTKKLSVNN